ncbi:MAG TPA: SRPBCC family protein [Kofleriaceae bacterium]|nr:SRPBCC family protein [Kofleriaceae bacterium]
MIPGTTAVTPDTITKQVTIQAPPSRVWRALTTRAEFATWFGMELDADFEVGKATRGTVTYQGKPITMPLYVERMDAESVFAFRWHPFAVEPGVDYEAEPTTLVEIKLEPAGRGTRLTVIESGFERIPEHRRARAFAMNSQGWAIQVENIARHVDA